MSLAVRRRHCSSEPQIPNSITLLGFYYDEVATVETLDDQPTFDLSVPENVTYVANGFVSHNTISFMMDCDTTGVEPDFSLVKSKKLVGGGEITIVNRTVPLGLEKLGYAPNEVDEVVALIDERNTVVGAPYVKAEHYPVFDCADRRARDPLQRPREDDGRDPAVHLGRDLEDGEPAGGGNGRGGRRARPRRVAARRQGDRDLPRQLQGRAAALGQGDKGRPVAAPTGSPLRRAPAGCRTTAPRSAASSASATTRATSTSASTRTARRATSSSTSPRRARRSPAS